MRLILAALMAAVAVPALADDCLYSSAYDLGEIQFIGDEDDPPKVMLSRNGASPEVCDYMLGDETGNEITCPSGDGGTFSFASKEFDGTEADLMVFEDHVWYRRCFTPT